MKIINQCLACACIAFLLGVVLNSCNKTTGEEPAVPVNPADTAKAKLFERLRFFSSSKIAGNAPGAPAGSSLKKSFKDTLFLADVKLPIKFLHLNGAKNVAGVYIGFGGAGGSFYYHVPELKEPKDNDTVSVIPIGFDPKGLPFPLSFTITMTPYGRDGQPIDQIIVPVKIEKPNDDPNQPALCGGLDLPSGDYWNWSMSYILDKNIDKGFSFMNYPTMVHGAGGQFIKGCCNNGISSYNTNCANDTAAHRTLHFPTFFQFLEESFNFSSNGTYDRTTIQENANPDPPASNFCGSGEGVVEFKSTITLYLGKWTIKTVTVPTDLNFFYTQRNYLTLQTTSSSGGGFGNAGGIVHYLDCRYLMLIQPDNEGRGAHLFKIYKRKGPNNPEWFLMT